MSGTKQGKLVVVSGPSGVGKSTIVPKVMERLSGRLVRSISATTRQPRPGEQEGVDYYFLIARGIYSPPRGGGIPRKRRGFRPRTLVWDPLESRQA